MTSLKQNEDQVGNHSELNPGYFAWAWDLQLTAENALIKSSDTKTIDVYEMMDVSNEDFFLPLEKWMTELVWNEKNLYEMSALEDWMLSSDSWILGSEQFYGTDFNELEQWMLEPVAHGWVSDQSDYLEIDKETVIQPWMLTLKSEMLEMAIVDGGFASEEFDMIPLCF